jgi:hypothetical protein
MAYVISQIWLCLLVAWVLLPVDSDPPRSARLEARRKGVQTMRPPSRGPRHRLETASPSVWFNSGV